jgi:hypothetical protein
MARIICNGCKWSLTRRQAPSPNSKFFLLVIYDPCSSIREPSICSNIFLHSDMTSTLHVTVILWNYTDFKVIIVLARKWNLFDVNPGFSSRVIRVCSAVSYDIYM